MNPQAEKELAVLERILEGSNVSIDPNLKKRVYEILSDIQYCTGEGRYDRAGMFIILGYDEKNAAHSSHYSAPDNRQNIRYDPRISKPLHIMTDEASERIASTKFYDGAVLINPEGCITDSGITIKNIDPDSVLEEKGIPNDRDLSKRFGFTPGVHNRHIFAISASWELGKHGDATTYTLSRKTGILRVYEKGDITYSQIPTEIKVPVEGVIVESFRKGR